MAYIPKKERDNLPDADFGDAERRLFPIRDQSDLDDAAHLIGKAKDPAAVKARIRAIAKRKGLKLPDAWEEQGGGPKPRMSESSPLDHVRAPLFALNAHGRREEGDYAVYPNSVLFRAGVYPQFRLADGGAFEVSREELWLAADAFDPASCHGNIEHLPYFKGRACELRSVRLDEDDPDVLRGEVAVPLGFDRLMLDHERNLSVEFNSWHDKTLSGLAVCINPIVPDASLIPAFSEAFVEFANKHWTYEGRNLNQQMHDMLARSGAVCRLDASQADRTPTHFHSKAEADHFQRMHDMTLDGGAMCSVRADKPRMSDPTASASVPGTGAGGVPAVAGTVPTHRPAPGAAARSHPTMKKTPFTKLIEWWTGQGAPAEVDHEALLAHFAEEAPAPSRSQLETDAPAPPPQFADPGQRRVMEEMRAEMERLRKETEAVQEKAREEQFTSMAVRFADEHRTRLYPHERPTLIAQLIQAAKDDHRDPAAKVFFSEAGEPKQGSRVDAIRAAVAARGEHGMLQAVAADRPAEGGVQFPAGWDVVPAHFSGDPHAGRDRLDKAEADRIDRALAAFKQQHLRDGQAG